VCAFDSVQLARVCVTVNTGFFSVSSTTGGGDGGGAMTVGDGSELLPPPPQDASRKIKGNNFLMLYI